MKYIAKFLLIIIAVGLVSSCGDEFLETDTTQFISASNMLDKAEYNPDIANGRVRGLYVLMYDTGTGGTTGHDDFGQKGYDIYTDMLCGDMVLGGYNYGWYQDVTTFVVTQDNTYTDNYQPWRYYYRIIYAANGIIDGLGGPDAVPDVDADKVSLGAALTMRAHSYMYLMYMFNEEFDLTSEAIPLYTEPGQESLPKSTGTQVWDRIESDLEAAVTLLDGQGRQYKNEINVDVARGLLTYAYVSRDKYPEAITVADQVIANYSVIPMTSIYIVGSGFNRNALSYIDGQDADWIWGMDLTLDQGLDLVSWWGQCDYYTYSYTWAGDPKLVDTGLQGAIRATDYRTLWFDAWHYPDGKFYHEERTVGKQREITADYVYMRVEEMILLKAEAAYYNGDEPGAIAALHQLVDNRDLAPAYLDALTGSALEDEIYRQWQIEMWGEGKTYLAMKRMKRTITRTGHTDYNISIPYNDTRLTFEIPYAEIQDNPNLTD